MPKHYSAQCWAMRPVGKYPQVYVRTITEKSVSCIYHEYEGQPGTGFVLTRRDARLLAKRINQCLDSTR